MENAANRSWKILPEKRPVDLEFFIDLGKPCFLRELESEASFQGVRQGVKK